MQFQTLYIFKSLITNGKILNHSINWATLCKYVSSHNVKSIMSEHMLTVSKELHQAVVTVAIEVLSAKAVKSADKIIIEQMVVLLERLASGIDAMRILNEKISFSGY